MAVKYVATIESSQSQEAVFEYLSDFSSARLWDPNIESAFRMDDGPVQEGNRFNLVSNFMGRHVELVYEVTQIESPKMFVVRADGGGFYSEDTILVEPQATGCTVQYQAVLGGTITPERAAQLAQVNSEKQIQTMNEVIQPSGQAKILNVLLIIFILLVIYLLFRIAQYLLRQYKMVV